MTNYEFGYARVSTTAQDLARQLDALRKEDIPDERVYADKKTGSSVNRPGLQALLSAVRPGDQITVYTLDRLGRNIREVLNMIHDLQEREVHLRSIADPMPVDTRNNEAMSHVATLMLALFAEMERVFTNERAAHARESRRNRGQRVGRKRAHSDQTIDYARLLRQDGSSLSTISEKTGIPRSSLHRYISTAATPDDKEK